MRSDIGSNCDDVIPADSSSSVSSPRSNSSHDDDIIGISGPEFIPKPIYNFSIPDVIKHEHRGERQEITDRLESNDDEVIPLRRKRKQTSRRENLSCAHADSDRPINKKRKKNVAATGTITEDDDSDCHRPPVIDLTDSHDEYHSDPDISDAIINDSRPLSHFPVITDLQRFRRQLQESRDARRLFRSPSVQRLHRLRRLSSRIAIDGSSSPSINNISLSTPEPSTLVTPEITADDSVMVINEIRSGPDRYDDDHSIAVRMATDATYSPPYHTPPASNLLQHRRCSRLRDDEPFNQFEERIRSYHRRNRERVRQISLEAHERLARIHDSLHRETSFPEGNQRQSYNAENPEQNDDDSTDDVEIIHEWNPNSESSMRYDLARPLSLLASPLAPFHPMHSLHGHHIPDFLGSLVNSFLPPPRLNHYNIHEYEALLNLAERIGPAKPRGLNKAQIDLIPSFRFSSTTAKETNTKCVICMHEYTNREKLRRLPCTHDFHSKCIDKWLKSNKTCPVCRNEVNPTAD